MTEERTRLPAEIEEDRDWIDHPADRGQRPSSQPDGSGGHDRPGETVPRTEIDPMPDRPTRTPTPTPISGSERRRPEGWLPAAPVELAATPRSASLARAEGS
jgi:hypothetical protein